MANEKEVKKVTEEQPAGETKNESATKATNNLIVEREQFTAKDGREMWGYAVYGEVRGREVKVDLVAVDQGGYDVLDIIFDIKPTAELVMHDETITNEDGTKRTYTVYEVQNADEDGEIYSYQVKPAKKSDKSLLDFILMRKAKKAGVTA